MFLLIGLPLIGDIINWIVEIYGQREGRDFVLIYSLIKSLYISLLITSISIFSILFVCFK